MIKRVIGLMSGTSLDGIDAACLETDGDTHLRFGPSVTIPYAPAFRERLRAILGRQAIDDEVRAVERDLTRLHADAVQHLRQNDWADIDLIGFHGHTIFHRPEIGLTRQIGDGDLLAALTGVPVVSDFRSADVAAGGEGAPLVPIFHQALARGLDLPLAVLNIGGVANVTWVAPGRLLSFDTGPGNAPIDDWMLAHTGRAMDEDGASAAQGLIDEAYVSAFLTDPYFTRPAPKSLDRDEFRHRRPDHLTMADGAATLAACTAAAISEARRHFPTAPKRWLVTGGGRRNPILMSAIAARLEQPVQPVEAVGWDGDALEAQAFAYLAARVGAGLPTSFPGTTGAREAVCGGRISGAAPPSAASDAYLGSRR